MRIEDLYRIYSSNYLITTDSRKVREGAIFFALKGEKYNGNRFAQEAIEKGCSYSVIDDNSFDKGNRYIKVPDVLETLQELACVHRKSLKIPVLAITGSNGKTTTKELVRRVLERGHKVCATEGNLNNHIGVPLSVLAVSDKTDLAVIEMGANHTGEIEKLCTIAKPTHGLITNIGLAHLEGFGSPENVRKAKSELFDFLENTGGTIFYNEKNEQLVEMLSQRNAEAIPYMDDHLSGYAYDDPENPLFLNLILNLNQHEYSISTKLAGNYNFENIMAAARIGLHFNVGQVDIVKAIETYQPVNNRSQIIHTPNNTVLLDAYNANPTSMEAAILDFIKCQGKDVLLILGDMLELGNISDREHSKLISNLEKWNIKNALLVGSIFTRINKNPDYTTFRNVDELIGWLDRSPVNNHDILIKGSRKIELEKVVNSL